MKAKEIFELSKDENFQDGMESKFSIRLIKYIEEYSDDAIWEIGYLINNMKVNAEVSSEALRCLGYINHPETYYSRLKLLQHNLNHPEYKVRDGAVLGLSYLNDPSIIPYLKLAIVNEECPILKKDMEQVLGQLENL